MYPFDSLGPTGHLCHIFYHTYHRLTSPALDCLDSTRLCSATVVLKHTALLNDQKAQWEARGYGIGVENQNAFRLRGRTATLAGKPDLIVSNGNDALIIEVKTGRERASHQSQVMIYRYALPKALPQYQGARIAGEIIYPTRTVKVQQGALPRQFIDSLGALIRRLAATGHPSRYRARRVPVLRH